jgi:hypothetical protein
MTMTIQFKRATKEQAKLRLALIGLAGSGKTYSALAIATNLVPDGRVALIDTERGSASLYADRFAFDTLDLDRHDPDDYVEAITAAEAAGYDVIVIDSLSHAWSGKDGALEQVDKISKREGKTNNFTAWRDVTPKHNRLVDAIVSSRCHIVVTMRSKMEYALEKDEKGKSSVRKIGLAPIQREGLDYEMTLVGDMDLTHTLVVSKSRCIGAVEVGDVIEKPGAKMAEKLRTWLMAGAVPVAKPAPVIPPAPVADTSIGEAVAAVTVGFLDGIRQAATLADLDRAASGPGKPAKGTDEHKAATAAYVARKAELQERAA